MNRRLSQWFNTAAFTPNATLTFGNAGRNIAVGPGFRNFDFSVMKNTRIGEQTNLQFRAEFFNIANHPNFALPEPTFLAAPNFGTLFQTLDTVQTSRRSAPDSVSSEAELFVAPAPCRQGGVVPALGGQGASGRPARRRRYISGECNVSGINSMLPVSMCKRSCMLFLVLLLFGAELWAAPQVKRIGPGLYAYISDNDSSANSTFLVGSKGILVVDTGFDATEGTKLLQAIHSVSSLPVEFIVNTHYHRDHHGGNFVVGPAAVVISTDWTRERTLAVIQSSPAHERSLFQPADVTFQEKLTIHLDPYSAEVYFPGKAHTSGDALVYFPQQRAIAAGDLFLNGSSPAMDVGSVENWIRALDQVLARPIDAVVPGHFELATKKELRRFRDYLNDLFTQVQALQKKGASLEEVRRSIHMERYSDFRQYPQYHATFADNAEVIYRQLQQH